MKKVSNWLLTGAILAVAFGCQTKKEDQDKEKKCGSCHKQSAVEKAAPVVETEAVAVVEETIFSEPELLLSSVDEDVVLEEVVTSEVIPQDPMEMLAIITEVIAEAAPSEIAPAQ
jgi:hypothetical protein